MFTTRILLGKDKNKIMKNLIIDCPGECLKNMKTKTVSDTLDMLDVISSNLKTTGVTLDSVKGIAFRIKERTFIKRGITDRTEYCFQSGFMEALGKSEAGYFIDCEKLETCCINQVPYSGVLDYTRCEIYSSNHDKPVILEITVNDLMYAWWKDEIHFPQTRETELLRQVLSEGIGLPVSVKRLLSGKYKTKYDLISQNGKLKDIPKSVNKYPLTVGYVLKRALKFAGKDGLGKFEGKENVENIMQIIKKEYHNYIRKLTTDCDMIALRHIYKNIPENLIMEYMLCCNEEKKKIDFSIRNPETITEAIVRMKSKYVPNRKLHIPDCFMMLETKLKGYNLLKTEREVYEEAVRQRNCLYRVYLNKIDRGLCGILTHEAGKKRYTIEVLYEKGKYTCRQFLGTANTQNYEERRKFISILDSINSSIVSVRTGRGVDVSFFLSDVSGFENALKQITSGNTLIMKGDTKEESVNAEGKHISCCISRHEEDEDQPF